MNKTLFALLALASACAAAAPNTATQPAPAASSADPCVRVRVTVHQVNGKAVEVRRQERDPSCGKSGVKLWD